MKFGIYIGSVAGTDTGLATGQPDDPSKINQALTEMEKGGNPILIRGYMHYLGDGELDSGAPSNIIQYATGNRKMDLVLCYRAKNYVQADWSNAITKLIQRFGDKLYSLQITEEPNLKTSFSGDGGFENIEKALLDGILTAKREVVRLNYQIKVGFNVVPSFNPADKFWDIIGGDDYALFRETIDYVGFDFYPGVFRPVAEDGQPNDLEQSVKGVLKYFRNVNLQTGKIPVTVPIHITENGWPTSPGKSYQKQSDVVEKIIRAICSVKNELNIAQYEFFSLRDVDSNNDNMFYHFGLLKDDYSPKPAFHTFCKLIDEFSSNK